MSSVKDWTTRAGFRATIIYVDELGHNCGYVAVPKGHWAYRRDYDSIDVEVHGGLTYASDRLHGIDDGGLWWVGFDCGHSGDAPRPGTVNALRRSWNTASSYKDEEYVSAECERLADQLLSTMPKLSGQAKDQYDLVTMTAERDAARAECERLRQALERIAGEECYEACPYTLPKRTKWFRAIAAAALSPKESPNG